MFGFPFAFVQFEAFAGKSPGIDVRCSVASDAGRQAPAEEPGHSPEQQHQRQAEHGHGQPGDLGEQLPRRFIPNVTGGFGDHESLCGQPDCDKQEHGYADREADRLRSVDDSRCWELTKKSPYIEKAAALVDALSIGTTERPVIILPTSMDDAWHIVETVLLMLPERFRAQIEFSVYESDPYRVLKRNADGVTIAPHLITTVPSSEGGNFQFKEGEYEGSFRIFNFIEPRFSKLGEVLVGQPNQFGV